MLIDILSTVSLKCGKWWKWWERSKQTKMSIGWHGASSEEPSDGPTNQHVMVLANFCVSFLQETPAWAFGWVLIIISNNPIVTSRIHCVACPCQCIQCCLDESWWIHTPSSPTLYNSTTWNNRDSVTSEHWSISRREPSQESNIPNFYYIYISYSPTTGMQQHDPKNVWLLTVTGMPLMALCSPYLDPHSAWGFYRFSAPQHLKPRKD